VNVNNMIFVGDPHGRHEHIIDAIQSRQPAACVLVGDQCDEEPIDQLFAAFKLGKTAKRDGGWLY